MSTEAAPSGASRFFGSMLSKRGMLFVLVAEMLVFWALNPDFMKVDNIRNVLVQSVFVLLLACGMTLVLIPGNIDLSVGGVMGLCAGVVILMLMDGKPLVVAILAGLAAGLAIGLFNGWLVAKVGINDFIVTLAMLSVASGLLNALDAHQPLRLGGEISGVFGFIASGTVLGIPCPVIIAAVVVLSLQFLIRSTAFGRDIFAIGINKAAAHLTGVRVSRARIAVFAISGLIAGLAGVITASQLGSAQAGLGVGYELQAIAAAVIGGTSLAGGRGDVYGAVIGALILGMLNNGLQLAGVDPAWFQVIVGISIIGAMLANDALRDMAVNLTMRRTRAEMGRDLHREFIREDMVLEGGGKLSDLIDVRLAYEVQAARQAAERATPGEKGELADIVAKMSDPNLTDEQYVALDGELHVAIMAAAKNPLLAGQYSTVQPLFKTYSLRVLQLPQRRQTAQAGHEAIVAAIDRGDVQAVEDAMKAHLLLVKSELAPYDELPDDDELSDLQAAAAGEVLQ